MKTILAVFLVAFLFGCSTVAPTPPTANVQIKGFLFKPETVQVPSGTTVVWTNQDDIIHSVTQGAPPNPTANGFDSDFFALDKTFSFTFQQQGDYPYFCKRHNHMVGVIQVTPR